MDAVFLTRIIARWGVLLAVLLLALASGVALLAPSEVVGYHCLVVPVGTSQPEWTMDVLRGTTAWDRRAMDAPFRYVQTTSPNGRYQIVRSQRVLGTLYEDLSWVLEDVWEGTQTPLEHSAGFDAWSADSRIVAYVSEPTEDPRRLTFYEPESGATRTETLPFEEYIEGMSADGRYLLLQNTLTFHRRVIDTTDFSDALRADENQQWIGALWPSVGNRLVLLHDGTPTLFDLDAGTQAALDGLPEAITRNVLWSPDGQRLAIVSVLSSGGFGLNLFDVDGDTLTEPVLAPVVPLPLPQFGAWSADAARFGFVLDDALVVIDTGTGTQETLVDGIQRMGMTWTYSPASALYLPLVHLQDDGLALSIVDTQHLRVVGTLIENAARIDLPFWSADASRVAVKWDTAQGETLLSWANSSDFVAHAVDEPGQFYSEDTPLDTTARWIDRGTTLLYSAYRDDESGVYLANVDTGATHRVTGDIDWVNPMMTLAASPDGSRYVMSYRSQGLNGPSAFVLFTTDGRIVHDLPTESYVMPVWSPDGTLLAHWDTGNSAINVYNSEGETVMQTLAAPPNGGFEWTACGQRAGR